MNISQKRKILSEFFLHFPILDSILNILKKRMTLLALVFLIDGLRKTRLDKCLEIPLSEDPSTSIMVNCKKQRGNLNKRLFTIFIDLCQDN